MKLNDINKLADQFDKSPKMPALFLGHGNPMNAIEDNSFVQAFQKIGHELPKPNAIICVSAHWETRGTQVTAMEQPRTIHDFGGFPQQLFEVQYPAPGSPALAQETKDLVKSTPIALDDKWGLDHGSWTVIKHLFPKADVPVIQLSLDYNKSPQEHYQLAQELAQLRDKGVLIVGSGNIVHNLRKVSWKHMNDNYAYDWAHEVRTKVNQWIKEDNHQALIDFEQQGKAFKLAIPTAEHYLPLLYTMALKGKAEEVSIFNDEALAGSLSMTSIKVG